MVNYGNGKIYKIEPIQGGDIYIGSTTKQYLSQRMDEHRSKYKKFNEGKRNYNTTSFEIFRKYGVENCRIILLESVNAENKHELQAREAYYIKTLECVNKCVPLRTKTEWGQDNADSIKEQKQNYYKQNKIDINRKHEKYYALNKEKILEHKKAKYEEDKVSILEKCKNYRQANKEKITAHLKELITCECGSSVSKRNKASHLKTKKHTDFMANKN